MRLRTVSLICTLLLLVLFNPTAKSQVRFKGKVLNNEDKTPVAFASVVTRANRNAGILTDTGGNFNFWYPRLVRDTDSLIVSAIGYKVKRVRLSELQASSIIMLESNPNILENVIVVSTLRGVDSQFGYFRSWREKNNSGEIGQIIDLPSQNFSIGYVQVKIQKNYDTCWLKLHLRNVGPSGFPEDELLKENVIISVTNNGLAEFDLGWSSMIIQSKLRKKHKKQKALQKMFVQNKKLFVGFEVLKCSNQKSDNPSFLFMGSEEGKNIFRDYNNSEWQVYEDYTIFIRVFIK